jgi:hypothetical protein
VVENKTFLTTQQLERAKQARDLARVLGCPSDKDMKTVLQLNMIKDCLVVEEDIILAEKIFGKDVAVIKGTTTQSAPKPVLQDTVVVPRALKEAQRCHFLHQHVLCEQDGLLHTISDKIHCRSSQWIPDQESETYHQYLEVVSKCIRRQVSKSSMSMQTMSLWQCYLIWRSTLSFRPTSHWHKNMSLLLKEV